MDDTNDYQEYTNDEQEYTQEYRLNLPYKLYDVDNDTILGRRTFVSDAIRERNGQIESKPSNSAVVTIYKNRIVVDETFYVSKITYAYDNSNASVTKPREIGTKSYTFYYDFEQPVHVEAIVESGENEYNFGCWHECIFVLHDEHNQPYNLKLCFESDDNYSAIHRVYTSTYPKEYTHGLPEREGVETRQNDYLTYLDSEVASYILGYFLATLNVTIDSIFHPFHGDVTRDTTFRNILAMLAEYAEDDEYAFRASYNTYVLEDELIATARHMVETDNDPADL